MAWVDVDCLRSVPDGASLRISAEARVTPLAQEEAFRRGIRLESEARAEHGAGFGSEYARSGGSADTVAVASDHGGFALKELLVGFLRDLGRRPVDLGPRSDAACDYPDYAAAVARRVAGGSAALGIVVDGAGIGSAMAANKIPGVLAANCWNVASARNAREHNHANILTLGAGHLDAAQAYEILAAFLGTDPGEGRHARRVGLIHALDASRGELGSAVPRSH